MRKFLWWREVFRDISTKTYYLIRKLTLALGNAWEAEGVLASADEIFFLSANDFETKSISQAVKISKAQTKSAAGTLRLKRRLKGIK